MNITQIKKNKQETSEFNRLNSVSPFAQVVIRVIIGIFALACVFPFIFVVIISFSSEDSIRQIGYSFFPVEWSLEAYRGVLELGKQLWVSLLNSVVVTVVGTLGSVTICVLYSYAIFRRDFKYRKLFTWFSFFTMIFGGGLAPTVIVCQNLLGMGNNYAALIVPLLVNPFYFIIMRSFFQTSVPFELIEAASIDGSGEWRTLLQVIIPITKPGIATIALLNMLNYWNDWFLAQLYITKNSLMPLQYLLVKMQLNAQFMAINSGKPSASIANLPTESLRMALCVLIVIPITFAYPFFQRYIISGLTVGAIKG